MVLVYPMITLGSLLMVYNIICYHRFLRHTHWTSESLRDRLSLMIPQVLMVLFLIGYIAVGCLLRPNLLVAAILFGGSVFVLIVLGRLFFIVDRVRENERRLAEVEEASRAKTVFLSNMSHDLRTPMNAILGYAQLGCRPDCGEDDMRVYLTKIRSAGDHLLALINDVLEMSRIESGKNELRPEPTELRRLAEETRDLFAAQMAEKQIDFELTCSVEDGTVLCDRDRLNRVLLNLLSNACKFTPEGGRVSLTLRQSGRSGEYGRYIFCVRDTGIGMSPAFAEKVFDAFERERSSTVSGIQGTGLGMTITKSIVDLMGGSIEVETEQGKGTAFTVRLDLPVLQDREASEAAHNCGCESAAGMFAGVRLLLAEDNPINLEITTLMLKELGFSVDTAGNGQEALDRLTQTPAGTYAAVLMDMQMPVMDGYEATRRIRRLEDPALSQIPVIAMTANAFSEDIALEREAGMSGHISKPISVPDMVRTLCALLPHKAGIEE